jgi:hypothetical protein
MPRIPRENKKQLSKNYYVEENRERVAANIVLEEHGLPTIPLLDDDNKTEYDPFDGEKNVKWSDLFELAGPCAWILKNCKYCKFFRKISNYGSHPVCDFKHSLIYCNRDAINCQHFDTPIPRPSVVLVSE